MNDLYIQGVHIDWNKIPVNSYLREIDAIKGLEELIFHNSITFFVGDTCMCQTRIPVYNRYTFSNFAWDSRSPDYSI